MLPPWSGHCWHVLPVESSNGRLAGRGIARLCCCRCCHRRRPSCHLLPCSSRHPDVLPPCRHPGWTAGNVFRLARRSVAASTTCWYPSPPARAAAVGFAAGSVRQPTRLATVALPLSASPALVLPLSPRIARKSAELVLRWLPRAAGALTRRSRTARGLPVLRPATARRAASPPLRSVAIAVVARAGIAACLHRRCRRHLPTCRSPDHRYRSPPVSAATGCRCPLVLPPVGCAAGPCSSTSRRRPSCLAPDSSSRAARRRAARAGARRPSSRRSRTIRRPCPRRSTIRRPSGPVVAHRCRAPVIAAPCRTARRRAAGTRA